MVLLHITRASIQSTLHFVYGVIRSFFEEAIKKNHCVTVEGFEPEPLSETTTAVSAWSQ
jgi:hypothetical protein